jgi:hypothetical protein
VEEWIRAAHGWAYVDPLAGDIAGQPDRERFERYAIPMLAEKEFFIRKPSAGYCASCRRMTRPMSRPGRGGTWT